MFWILLVASCFMALTSASPDPLRLSSHNVALKFQPSRELEDEWQSFKIKYGKTYNDVNEELFRKKVFAKHLEAIEINNYLYSKGLKTFTMGINRFADLENSEFVKLMTGYIPRDPSGELSSSTLFLAPVNVTLPDEVDWRKEGYVTPVKDQKQCGSCWAFSATGALEGQHFRASGQLVSLSEQQLVDCSKENHGCAGGWTYKAFEYIASNEGIDTEDSYPYEARDGPCRYSSSSIGATCKSYKSIVNSESELKAAVASVGPISVAIDASRQSFSSYQNGVYDDPDCNSANLDHAVLVVGYGTTPDGLDYWIVKNSWGVQWGMDGYIWMSRNKDNQCGIASDATYPVV